MHSTVAVIGPSGSGKSLLLSSYNKEDKVTIEYPSTRIEYYKLTNPWSKNRYAFHVFPGREEYLSSAIHQNRLVKRVRMVVIVIEDCKSTENMIDRYVRLTDRWFSKSIPRFILLNYEMATPEMDEYTENIASIPRWRKKYRCIIDRVDIKREPEKCRLFRE